LFGKYFLMVAYAYLRVSTDHQDLDNQRHGILEYANHHGISSLHFVEDTVSGSLKWHDRAVGKLLLEIAQSGDVVIFAPYKSDGSFDPSGTGNTRMLYAARDERSYCQATNGSRWLDAESD
jgi:hypothetical protein